MPTENLKRNLPFWIDILDNSLLAVSIVLLILFLADLFSRNAYFNYYSPLYNLLWVAFAVEFGLKIFFAKDKFAYLRHDFFLPIIILFPFLKPLQLFPISRFALLVFADQVYDRFNVFRKYRIIETLLVISIIIILSADLFLIFEKEPGTTFKTFGDAVWFSVVTIATVGYGDIYPKTFLGRSLAVILIIFGISTFSIVVAKISSFFFEQETRTERKEEAKEIKKVLYEEKSIEEFEKKLERNEEEIKQRLAAIEEKL